MINLAQLADNAPLYIVHLSNGLGLDYLRLAQRRRQPVWVETCPQYLLLDDRYYEREDALGSLLSPPLRNASNNDALWCVSPMVRSTCGDRHCPAFSMAQRQQLSGGDFSRCPNGLPGVEKPPAVTVFPRRHDRADFSAAFRRANQRNARRSCLACGRKKDDWRPAPMATW